MARSPVRKRSGRPLPAERAASPDPSTSAPPGNWDRAALLLLAVWLVAVLWAALAQHPTPLYSVESDVVGEYVPAAQSLRSGRLPAEHYQSKGFGYPLLLAAAAPLAHDDYYLAARLLNVGSGVAGAGLAYLLFRAFLGAQAGFFVLAGLVLNPSYVRGTVEAATDIPTFALLMAASLLLITRTRGWALLASGFLAGYAVITRYNCVFLPAAGVLVLAARGSRRRSLGAYAVGLAVPIAAWLIAARAVGGGMLGTQNVMNMAYEIYGRGLSSEEFWSTRSAEFRSFWDVARHEPALFVGRILSNLGTRWLQDVRELLPVWLGALALPGIALGWRGRPGWPRMAIHMALCYLVLAPIFYQPRFGLYLIPFYLSGAVALILFVRFPWRRSSGPLAGVPERSWERALRPALLSALILPSGWSAIANVRDALAKAPHETRAAGLALRLIGRPGDRVMARKPNVAYFAGMAYVPLPDLAVVTYPGLIEAARTAGAHYLFFSAAEEDTRPQFVVLADSGVALPGLRQVGYRVLDPTRYYALYEFTGEPCDPETIQTAVLSAARRFVGRHPNRAGAHAQLATQLLVLQRYREALGELDIAQHLEPSDLTVARMQEYAHEQLGEYEQAAEAGERGIRLGSTTGWERSRLGWIRIQQGRSAEAVPLMKDALRREPGNADYRLGLGVAYFMSGDRESAAREFEEVLRHDPGYAPARLYAARVRWLQGESRRALALLEAGSGTGPDSAALRALGDSIRAAMRGNR